MLDPGVVMVMTCGVPFVLVLVVHHLIVRNGLVKLKKRKKEKKKSPRAKRLYILSFGPFRVMGCGWRC